MIMLWKRLSMCRTCAELNLYLLDLDRDNLSKLPEILARGVVGISVFMYIDMV